MIQKRLNLLGSLFLFYLSVVKCNRQTPVSGNLRNSIDLNKLSSSYNDFTQLLNPIAIRRESGSVGNRNVREFISSKMRNYGWHVEEDSFTDSTPYGQKSFANIIATYQQGANFKLSQDDWSRNAKNRIVLACHYDSKYFTEFDFIGAIDSAVPCAMLLDLAKFLDENLYQVELSKAQRHLQFIFFDGEEAFQNWNSLDSIYGSRYHAKRLERAYGKAGFDSIDLFVLLDLIGAKSCEFPNFFDSTSKIYRMLSKIESMLIKKGLLNKKTPYFFKDAQGLGRYGRIEDDHVPFMNKDVPILHLIASPFPPQWHTQFDNLENLDANNIQDLRIIFKYFLLQILNEKEVKKNRKKPNEEF